MEIARSPWEERHYRFGLAGEGQADLIEQFLTRRRGVVLDVGCGGQGWHAANLAALSTLLIAADKNVDMVQSASADRPMPGNVTFLVADADNLPLPERSVDHVVALGMFVYITKRKKREGVFAEFRRVTERKGMVLVSDSVVREKAPLIAAATATGLHLIRVHEGADPPASGPIKRRYLYAFEVP